ncbi:MAG: hypothetical protein ACREQQ_16735, partial [Candidatus Binatia bacterium]
MLNEDLAPFPVELASERRLDRRRFLWTAGVASLVALTGDRLGRRLEARAPAIAPLEPQALDGLREGEARAIECGETTTLAVRLPGGDVVAFDRRCPHLG